MQALAEISNRLPDHVQILVRWLGQVRDERKHVRYELRQCDQPRVGWVPMMMIVITISSRFRGLVVVVMMMIARGEGIRFSQKLSERFDDLPLSTVVMIVILFWRTTSLGLGLGSQQLL
ncbi:hypothetical protein B0F90DRAFT_406800 [Multifurca ochricompacta]|uniref:Uncharacterized protein n=1 Tax=Multifurca ochricompacta TaxID=376703 RepID=A0AAD4LX66_9AGAM|nr:hypothetical protein B0F90DRAFT_406800 [Multifurca ochricompacta]